MKEPLKSSITTQLLSSRLLGVGLFISTCVVLAPFFYSPIGLPKLFFLSLFVCLSYIFLPKLPKSRLESKDFLVTDALIVFVVFLVIINLCVNHWALTERIYGVFSRNSGALSVIVLISIFSIAKRISEIHLSVLMNYLISSLLIVCTYYSAQRLGMDFTDYSETYLKPSSTLGNPNFVSSFIGFAALLLVWKVSTSKSWVRRISVTLLFLTLIVVIWDTESVQGLAVLACSLATFSLLHVKWRRLNRRMVALVGFSIVTITSIGSVFALQFNLRELLSLDSRLVYWKVATRITIDAPLFGKGFDSFRDLFPQYYTSDLRPFFSDTPHNYFFDYFVAGGLPLGFAMGILLLSPLVLGINAVLNNHRSTQNLRLLSSLYLGFLLQALISPIQIGIASWGFAIGGLILGIVGTERNTPRIKVARRLARHQLSFPITSISLVAMVLLMVPALRTDALFLRAAKASNGNLLVQISTEFPQDTRRFVVTSLGLNSSRYFYIARNLEVNGLEHNPKSVELWRLLRDNPNASRADKELAIQKLKTLDPFELISK